MSTTLFYLLCILVILRLVGQSRFLVALLFAGVLCMSSQVIEPAQGWGWSGEIMIYLAAGVIAFWFLKLNADKFFPRNK